MEARGVRVAETDNDAIAVEMLKHGIDGYIAPVMMSPFQGGKVPAELVVFDPLAAGIIPIRHERYRVQTHTIRSIGSYTSLSPTGSVDLFSPAFLSLTGGGAVVHRWKAGKMFDPHHVHRMSEAKYRRLCRAARRGAAAVCRGKQMQMPPAAMVRLDDVHWRRSPGGPTGQGGGKPLFDPNWVHRLTDAEYAEFRARL